MAWSGTGIDTHCCSSVSHPSWDIYEWFEELLISSTKPAMVNTVSLLPKTTLKFYVKKYQLLGILSAQEMRWCASRRDMHCCLGVSYPSLDKQGWLEELLAAPTRPVMFHTASLQQEITLKFHVKYQILVEPSLIGNGIMWCKERHPLLLECSTTFLRCTRIIGRAPNSIYKTLMVTHGPHHVSSAKNSFGICSCKISYFRYPLHEEI